MAKGCLLHYQYPEIFIHSSFKINVDLVPQECVSNSISINHESEYNCISQVGANINWPGKLLHEFMQ